MVPEGKVEMLVVEDDPGDIELLREGLVYSRAPVRVHYVDDGIKAMKFLRREEPYASVSTPDLVLLDLNLPRKDGREVLYDIRNDETLKSIPVVVFTTSENESDVDKCYRLGANCCITKPIGLDEFMRIMEVLQEFWFTIVRLPHRGHEKGLQIKA